MEAGRELDALIAEKVMGLQPWPVQEFSERVFRAALVPQGHDPLPCSCPKYSSDIAAAWDVVERLRDFKHPEDEHAGFTVWQYWKGGYAAGWSWHEAEYGVELADTAPHAICLAALKAVGVDDWRDGLITDAKLPRP